MLRKIRNHPVLRNLIKDSCCENGICVSFAEDIDRDNTIILKVDEFYNTLGLEETPPSIDCFIIRKCVNGGYGLTLVELKNIHSSKGFDIQKMKGKFVTTIDDFMKTRFKEPLDVDYKTIKLFFVSNIEVYRRDLGLKMEVLMNTRFKINGRQHMIQPRMPDPTISNCY